MNINEKIEFLMQTNGVTKAILARDTGISQSAFTELKKGRAKSLSLKNLEKVAEYFGVSMDYFSEQKNKPTENIDEQRERLNIILSSFSKDQVAEVLKFAEMYALAHRNQEQQK